MGRALRISGVRVVAAATALVTLGKPRSGVVGNRWPSWTTFMSRPW